MDGPGDAAQGQVHDGVRYDFGKLSFIVCVLHTNLFLFSYNLLKFLQFLMLILEMENLYGNYPITVQVYHLYFYFL